jgi:hypothetical protein
MDQGIVRSPSGPPSGRVDGPNVTKMNAETFCLTTPVLLVIFNRPDTTRQVLESIRAARPPALYVAADGPRSKVEGDERLCLEARRAAMVVDWPCEVHTLVRDKNAGCALNTSGGISWFFEHVEEGIILDDDCVPSASFYRFCQELLGFYGHEPRIMHIAGNSHQYGRRRGSGSYYFSRYANFWGWATWRRAWKHFDASLTPPWELKDDWSAPWQLSMERANGIAIVPNINLVKNVGYGAGATHTTALEPSAFVEAGELSFPLLHPRQVEVDRAADVFTYYAHHRLVRHWNLIWMYQLRDFLMARLKPAKRTIMRLVGRKQR